MSHFCAVYNHSILPWWAWKWSSWISQLWFMIDILWKKCLKMNVEPGKGMRNSFFHAAAVLLSSIRLFSFFSTREWYTLVSTYSILSPLDRGPGAVPAHKSTEWKKFMNHDRKNQVKIVTLNEYQVLFLTKVYFHSSYSTSVLTSKTLKPWSVFQENLKKVGITELSL